DASAAETAEAATAESSAEPAAALKTTAAEAASGQGARHRQHGNDDDGQNSNDHLSQHGRFSLRDTKSGPFWAKASRRPDPRSLATFSGSRHLLVVLPGVKMRAAAGVSQPRQGQAISAAPGVLAAAHT